MTEQFQTTLEVDAQGLDCPMPLLKAKQAINRMDIGQCVRVLATDPGSERDFATFAQQSGHTLLHSDNSHGRFEFILMKTDTR
ncbi:MAG: sulfurtransferase TusA family protein [Pseudomonadales bacterium]